MLQTRIPKEEDIFLKTLRLLPSAPLLWRDPETDPEAIERLASRHALGALLYRSLGRLGLLESVPDQLRSRLREAYLSQAARSEHVLLQMKEIKQMGAAEGISVIFLKGLAAAIRIHGDAAARNFCDLDVLVPEPDLQRFHAALVRSGYRRTGIDPGNRFAVKYALNHWMYRKPGKILLEVHWKLHHFPFFRMDGQAMEPVSREVVILGEPFACLDEEREFMLQLFSAVSEPSLRRLIDISVMLQNLRGRLEGGWKGFFERRLKEGTDRLAADRIGAALWATRAREAFPELREILERVAKGSFDLPPRPRPENFWGKTSFKLRLFGHPCVTWPWWLATAFWRRRA
jgi:hypothetical protein